MTRALRVQGWAFCAAALGAAAGSALLPRLGVPNLGAGAELIVAAALIVLLGVPHGGLDAIFALHLYRVRTVRRWAGFGVLYGLLAAGVVAVWLVAPALFLAGFLLVSAAHFSGDPGPGTRALSRVAYGGAVVVLPALLHGPEVARLFSLLVGPPAAEAVMGWLAPLGLPWAAALAGLAAAEARRSPRTALEMIAVGALAVCAPPLVGFTVYFCAMHSARHILRTLDWAGRPGRWLVAASGALPTLGAVALAGAGWAWFSRAPFEAGLVQAVFVGLAALTVPHMALVERVRLAGWRAPG